MTPEYIIFTYKFIEPLNKEETIKTKFNKIKSSEKEENIKFLGNNLPNTLEFNKWGHLLEENESFILIKKFNSKLQYHINKINNQYKIQFKSNGRFIMEFIDELIEKNNLSSFIRKNKNHEYIFINGKLILKKKNKRIIKNKRALSLIGRVPSCRLG